MKAPAMYDHFSSVDSEHSDGIYRVVGVHEDYVMLLQVAGADERRIHTGKVISVDRSDLDRFAMSENPDRNRPLWDSIVSTPEILYWSLRVFGQQLALHPLRTSGALVLIVMGYLGEEILLLCRIARRRGLNHVIRHPSVPYWDTVDTLVPYPYFKSKFIADEVGLSAKEVGALMTKLTDSAAELEIEKWSYTSATTWRLLLSESQHH